MPGETQACTGMQNGLTHNLYNWLDMALSQVFEQAPVTATWNDADPGTLPSSQIYENQNTDPSTIGWVKTYRANPSEADLALMRPFVEDKLIIGFELSPFQCALLNKLETPYVSLAIHPIRFLPPGRRSPRITIFRPRRR